MSESINPYAPPASETPEVSRNPLSIWAILFKAWRIFTLRLMTILVIVLAVCVPYELLSSYIDYFVFGPDDWSKSFKLSLLLDSLFGLVATAGVIHLALHQDSAAPATMGQALVAGLKAWPRMWWTWFVSNMMLLLSLLLLVVPFFYVLPRLLLSDSVALNERLAGSVAVNRSFELVQGRYWLAAGLLLIILLLTGAPMVVFWALPESASLPDHWMADAAINLAFDLVGSFETIVLACAYQAFSRPPVQPGAEPLTIP